MKITLLYQVSHYIKLKKQRNIKRWDQQNYLVILEGFVISDPFITRFHCTCFIDIGSASVFVCHCCPRGVEAVEAGGRRSRQGVSRERHSKQPRRKAKRNRDRKVGTLRSRWLAWWVTSQTKVTSFENFKRVGRKRKIHYVVKDFHFQGISWMHAWLKMLFRDCSAIGHNDNI